MARITLRGTVFAIVISAGTLNLTFAQTQSPTMTNPSTTQSTPKPASPAGERAVKNARRSNPQHAAPQPLPANMSAQPVNQAGFFQHAGVPVHHPRYIPAPDYLPPNAPNLVQNGYPYLNAPLYPTPLPNIPYQTGATVVTNQAFNPHEMLYAHKYKAIYPPYYYQVNGAWKVLPWGVCQGEHWRLRGTTVTVKYNSTFSLCSGFCPPAVH